MEKPIWVGSETGRLRRVLLHRPGAEMEQLTPQLMNELLFDDIPWVEGMRREHDAFAQALRQEGCEVVYLEDMLEQVLAQGQVAAEFVDELLSRWICRDKQSTAYLRQRLLQLSPAQLVECACSGLPLQEGDFGPGSLSCYLQQEHNYLLSPLPNLYFTRDLGTVIGDSMILCAMNTPARRREAALLATIVRHHSDFAHIDLLYDNASCHMPLEGGDVLVLSDRVIAVGCSQRTSAAAVDYLAQRFLADDEQGQRRLLVVGIPEQRACMHLDTVMTMVDADCFIYYPWFLESATLVEISAGSKGSLNYRVHDNLEGALASVLGLGAVELIKSGEGNSVSAAREQWNDAANTLCVAPRKVIVYNRNDVSNRALRAHGVETIEIEGSELVRGRGGPHCMSLPLLRDR